ncbi:uncharacterized protein TNCV_1636361 [Trichonephila clavipes]|uniref:Uncharacterized protein n=1 Tax=Trichonephila clavipes TaxID=2585209 RepID=A0A8X6RLH6_TRICX|nr:uncharacterized protein TNCV_1636361 [Trichonephila clavipes]
MFQSKSNLEGSTSNELGNRKKKHKRMHFSPKRKPHSKRPHSRPEKRWLSNINKSHLKHANYASDYIGAERLTTKRMGFLAKGKISDSISRLEKIMPENCRNLSKQDLHRVLTCTDNSKNYSFSPDYTLPASTNCSVVLDRNDSTSSSDEETSLHRKAPNNSRKKLGSSAGSSINEETALHRKAPNNSRKKLKSSAGSSTKSTKVSRGNSPSPKTSSFDKYNEINICKEIISKKFQRLIISTNETIFPNTSNKHKSKKGLLDLKSQYDLSRKPLSSSNNCESLQNTQSNESVESYTKEDFKLNPILTQESLPPKSMENMFPSSQNFSSDESDSDIEACENSEPILQNRLITFRSDSKPSTSNSGRESSLALIPSSPVSSSGSPVWVPELSPVKFVPDYLPTPKIYFRQKMF